MVAILWTLYAISNGTMLPVAGAPQFSTQEACQQYVATVPHRFSEIVCWPVTVRVPR